MRDSQVCPRRVSLTLVILVILTLCMSERVLAQSRNTFPMPNVVGLTVPEAEERVYSAGRSIRATSANAQIVERRPDKRPAGQIIRQLEPPGTQMRRYTDDVGGVYGEVSFQVIVSTGPNRVQDAGDRTGKRAERDEEQDKPSFAEQAITGFLQEVFNKAAQPRDTFPMPEVIGLTVAQAEERVYSAGRSIGASSANARIVERRTDERPAGRIIQQLESPGASMTYSTDDVGGNYGEVSFRVVVSTGPPRPTTFAMPNVIGLTIVQAEERVYSAGRSIGATSADAQVVERRTDERPAGQIIQQLERPGTPIRPYTDDVGGQYGQVSFRVVVSTGPEPAPNFVGDTVDAAMLYAGQNDISLNVGTGQRNPRITAGIVIRQSPAAGQAMSRRQVTVYPSTGYPLPNYVRQIAGEARQDSRRLGFELRERSEEKVDIRRGEIFGQDPEAGTLLPLDRPVVVFISEGWTTPDFLTLGENEAMSLANAKQVGLEIAERRRNREVQPGIVIEQNPSPGVLIAANQPVRIVLSTADPTPRLIGFMEEAALAIAQDRDINLDISRKSSEEYDFGLVTDQSPRPNAPLPGNGRVTVIVSSGRPTPDLVGKTEEEASSIARSRDITLVRITPDEHFELSAGRVIKQTPVKGTMLPADRRVEVSLSLGWPVAPDAVGRDFAVVKKKFRERHPNASVEKNDGYLTIEPVGTVISQQPQAGVKLDRKQRLRLVVAAAKPPWLWPVTGLLLVILALAGIAGLKSVLSRTTLRSISTENPGGVRLRITKDHGVQSTETKENGPDGRADCDDIIKVRVKVDLGEQTAGPIDDKGEKP